jgi:undecaprenyl-diphosphatase
MHALRPSPDEKTIGSRDLTQWRSRPGRWLREVFGALADRLRNTDLAALTLLGVAAVLAVGATMLAGEIYESVASGHGITQWDEPVLQFMVASRTPGFTTFVAAFSNSGGALWMTIITGVAIAAVCLKWRRWTPLVLMLITVGGSLAMTVVGKRLADRARPPYELAVPPYESSASFPSGHTLNSIVITGMFCYLLVSHLTNTLARVATVTIGAIYTIAMGLSRVYLGHHWLTDVLAAWCLGLAWLTVVITAHRLWLTDHQKHALPRHGTVSPRRPARGRDDS